MSQSPTAGSQATRASYLEGWVAINKMIRESLSWSGYERNCAFLNVGEERFADASAVSGLDFDDDGRGVAVTDWDLDGALDLWLFNRTGPRVRFMRNTAPAGASVALLLEGTRSNRDAIGARVELFAAGSVQPLIRTRRAGSGFLAQSSAWMHFGLGARDEAAIEKVVVRWPHGERETFEGLEPGARYVLLEGAGKARAIPKPAGMDASAELVARPVEAPASSERARIRLPVPLPLPRLEYEAASGETRTLVGASGPNARLVLFWASWCAPCRGELRLFARSRAALARLGIEVVALSVDEPEARAQASRILADLSWPHAEGFADASLVEAFDVIQRSQLDRYRRLPLPASFLVDRAGRLAAIYKGAVDLEALEEDRELEGLAPDVRRARSTPFDGRWQGSPPGLDLSVIAQLFTEHGRPDIARAYLDLSAGGGADPARTGQPGSAMQIGARINAGVELARAGRHAQAIEAFDEALDMEPGSVEALNNKGNSLAALTRHAEAIRSYRAALESDPEHADARVNLARSLSATGKAPEARRELERVLAREPGHAPAHQELGILHFGTERLDRAGFHFEAALRLAPEVANNHFNLGLVRSRQDRLPEAIDLARAALALDPDYYDARGHLAISLHRAERLPEAIEAYERALTMRPRAASMLFNLGAAYAQNGDRASALGAVERLRAIDAQRAGELSAIVDDITGQ